MLLVLVITTHSQLYLKSSIISILHYDNRIALMANQYIKANTELTYDYGYLTGNVEGKHRDCLCGSTNCRVSLY